MSAIAGYLNFSLNNNRLERMADSLRHRFEKYYSYENEGLGLLQGNNPINFSRELVSVLAGNFYNWKDLKKAFNLGAENQSDFLNEIFLKYGEDVFKLLEGSFVFAIWDNKVKKLLLVRDQLGEKA